MPFFFFLFMLLSRSFVVHLSVSVCFTSFPNDEHRGVLVQKGLMEL